MFEKILLATDGSAHAEEALKYARDLAVREGAQAVVVHAFRHVPDYIGEREWQERLSRNLDEAERITKALMVMSAFIALLTAFFIIVTTMSMSLFERQPQLGILRCVGTTRGQLAAMILLEMIPLGVFGTIAGLVLGFGVTEAASYVIAHRSGAIISSSWGIKLAVAAECSRCW